LSTRPETESTAIRRAEAEAEARNETNNLPLRYGWPEAVADDAPSVA
jgi:hypothetical protein